MQLGRYLGMSVIEGHNDGIGLLHLCMTMLADILRWNQNPSPRTKAAVSRTGFLPSVLAGPRCKTSALDQREVTNNLMRHKVH